MEGQQDTVKLFNMKLGMKTKKIRISKEIEKNLNICRLWSVLC